MQSLAPTTTTQGATEAPSAKPRLVRVLLVVVAGVCAILGALLVTGLVVARRGAARPPVQLAVVRVVTGNWSGTGFIVKGPDRELYVATAYHVVESGNPILVERTVESGDRRDVTAYPGAEIAAFDDDADLAILRVGHVDPRGLAPLPLASGPTKDEDIQSYGFPESNLAKQSGMMSKPGKVLSLVKFPVRDRRTHTVVRDDAIDGLLISAEIEPGFSGGPTCNTRGEVVGVNVTKDNEHRAQNGVVSVAVLRRLLARVAPTSAAREPTPAEVKALLERVEREYLLLPIDRRFTAREQDYVSTDDLPRLEALTGAIRRLENDGDRDESSGLSGQAMLGLVLLRLPGRPLETYLAPTTRRELARCAERERSLERFFGQLVPRERGKAADAPADDRCAALAFRPLVWDLTALALQWEGTDRAVTVTRVETVDQEAHVYRAWVRFAGVGQLVDVWLATDGGRLRVKLFDKDGRPAGLSAARSVPSAAFQGTWTRKEPRGAKDLGKGIDADGETEETLVVSLSTDESVSVTHQLRRRITITANRTGHPLCGRSSSLDLGLEQRFTGRVDNGSAIAFRHAPARALGADMARCPTALTYQPDRVAVLKPLDGRLLMIRTDGGAFPEVAEFERSEP